MKKEQIYQLKLMQGSKTQAQDGTLVILVAGDRSLFDDCQSCFQVILMMLLNWCCKNVVGSLQAQVYPAKHVLKSADTQAMGKNSFYLGEVGNSSKMNLVLQVILPRPKIEK